MKATTTLIAASIVALAGVAAVPSASAGDPQVCTAMWVTDEPTTPQDENDEGTIVGETNNFLNAGSPGNPQPEHAVHLLYDGSFSVRVPDGAIVDYAVCLAS